MIEDNGGYLRQVAAQLARHDATLDSHNAQIARFSQSIDSLASEIRELREILHGDGKETDGLISDLREARRAVIWMRRLVWLAGAQAAAILGGLLFLIVKLGVTGGP